MYRFITCATTTVRGRCKALGVGVFDTSSQALAHAMNTLLDKSVTFSEHDYDEMFKHITNCCETYIH